MSTVVDQTVVDIDRPDLGQYARSDLGKSLRSLATSLVPFLVLWAAMFAAFGVSYWLVLLLAVPAAGFLVRTYIMFQEQRRHARPQHRPRARVPRAVRRRGDRQGSAVVTRFTTHVVFSAWNHYESCNGRRAMSGARR
jgi:hypothetical protein